MHGVSNREVLHSLWSVVDSINSSKEPDMVFFPETHAEQMSLVLGAMCHLDPRMCLTSSILS